jgi:hypothetical protein
MHKNIYSITIIVIFLIVAAYLSGRGLFYIKNARALNNLATTSVTVIMVCGDGIKDPEEVCDKGNPPEYPVDVGTTTCAYFGYDSGNLLCNEDCTAFDPSECYTCGNNIKEQVEECDGTDFGGATCFTLGYNSGSLSCTTLCKINLMDCTTVGNTPGTGSGGGAIGGGGSTGGGSAGFDTGRDSPLPGTKVIIKGTAYPNSEVHVLKDGAVLGLAKADDNADFVYENSTITPGVASLGFWSEDKNNLRSSLYALTFRISSNAITTITGVYIPPTIGTDKVTLKNGENITIFGSSIPLTDVFLEIHSDEGIQKQLKSDDDGEWALLFNTSPLAKDSSHLAKAYFQKTASGATIKSGYSSAVNFYLGAAQSGEACPGADLNKDKRVNLTDFSILLYYWGTNNACADQNHNGRVELTDFSIMMYYWTG